MRSREISGCRRTWESFTVTRYGRSPNWSRLWPSSPGSRRAAGAARQRIVIRGRKPWYWGSTPVDPCEGRAECWAGHANFDPEGRCDDRKERGEAWRGPVRCPPSNPTTLKLSRSETQQTPSWAAFPTAEKPRMPPSGHRVVLGRCRRSGTTCLSGLGSAGHRVTPSTRSWR